MSTRAIDIDCPDSHATVGQRCYVRPYRRFVTDLPCLYCPARIKAAARKTREANRERRKVGQT